MVAIHLQIDNMNYERVPRFRAINKKWSRQRIIAFDQGKRISRLLDGIPKTVQRIRFENIARF